MKYLLQFIAALAVAAWSECRTSGGCLSKAKAAFRSIFKDVGKTSMPLANARLNACRKCPIFYAKLQTCGSPLQRDPEYCEENGKPMGCYCYMPLKATTKCNCWLYDETDGTMGWPKILNDFPHEHSDS